MRHPPRRRKAVPPPVHGGPNLPGCTGKRRHASAEDAVGFAARMVRHTGSVRPYACQHCGGWHLTGHTVWSCREG